jgi:hypothetical protein
VVWPAGQSAIPGRKARPSRSSASGAYRVALALRDVRRHARDHHARYAAPRAHLTRAVDDWCTHRVRTTLSTLVAKDISRRRGRGCRNWACQVRSWSFEGAGLDLGAGGRSDRLHIRVHLWWLSRWVRRLLVVTGARCPLTKPVVAAVELQPRKRLLSRIALQQTRRLHHDGVAS